MLINQKERSGFWGRERERELCRSFFFRLTLARSLDGTSLTLTPASCFFRLLGISRLVELVELVMHSALHALLSRPQLFSRVLRPAF